MENHFSYLNPRNNHAPTAPQQHDFCRSGQRERERRRERNRERNSGKGHGTKQPLQGRGLRPESQSEGEVLRTATSAAAEAARDEERAGEEVEKGAAALSSLPYFRCALFTLLTKHDCWEAKRKLFYQMGFLTLFYYEINFQHRFAVVDVPLPSLSLPLSVGWPFSSLNPILRPAPLCMCLL